MTRHSSPPPARDDTHRPDTETGSSCVRRRGSLPRGFDGAEPTGAVALGTPRRADASCSTVYANVCPSRREKGYGTGGLE
jgi:hypothetical protein